MPPQGENVASESMVGQPSRSVDTPPEFLELPKPDVEARDDYRSDTVFMPDATTTGDDLRRLVDEDV